MLNITPDDLAELLSHFFEAVGQEDNTAVTITTGEFRYLPAQAAALGVGEPDVQRLALPLPDGRELSALRFGDTDPQVTFLHGAGLNAHTWDTTALLLGRPALAIDLAGHGDSSWRDDLDYSPQTLAADVVRALDAWTDRPQVLVGQSLGGLTAATVAAQRPEAVANLVVVDITPGVDPAAAPAVLAAFYAQTDFASRDEAVDRAQAFGFGGEREDAERGVFFNTRVREDGRVEWKHHFARLVGATLQTAPGSVRAERGWADLDAVTAPITFVRATRGFVSDTDADGFERRVPAASVVVLDATHNVQETAPTALATLIDDLVASAQ